MRDIQSITRRAKSCVALALDLEESSPSLAPLPSIRCHNELSSIRISDHLPTMRNKAKTLLFSCFSVYRSSTLEACSRNRPAQQQRTKLDSHPPFRSGCPESKYGGNELSLCHPFLSSVDICLAFRSSVSLPIRSASCIPNREERYN